MIMRFARGKAKFGHVFQTPGEQVFKLPCKAACGRVTILDTKAKGGRIHGGIDVPGREFALRLDAADALASRRELFYIRPGQIYMDGNSLGLCSKGAERAVLRALEDWKKYGIGIWTGAETDYFLYYESIGAKLARLINARPEEVTVCASTTLNIHQCVATFWKPDARRYKIVVDELNFPTDRYAVTSQIAQRGLEPDEVLKVVPSRDGKTLADGGHPLRR